MSLTVSEYVGTRVVEEARKQGVSVDTLLERLINNAGGHAAAGEGEIPELPVLHLGPMGALHRRDIYDDAR